MNIQDISKQPFNLLMPLGAIVGDICGSKYEGKRKGIKYMPDTLIDDDCHFTDDTVMTIACLHGIKRGLEKINYSSYVNNTKNQNIIRSEISSSLRFFARKYPHAGYGRAFKTWFIYDNAKPYGSFGNGSAMRCSYAGWAAQTTEEARLLARLTAEPTHNHPLGIKGAEIIASMIYELRMGKSKSYLKEKYHSDNAENSTTHYNLGFTLDEIRPKYNFSSSCEGSVPQAIVAFLEGNSFEEVIKLAISIGGDSDTISAIAGSLAETIYEIPYELKEKALLKLDEFLLQYVCSQEN